MAINPLQLPAPIRSPEVDFSPLAQIGMRIGDYRQDQREQEAFGSYVDEIGGGRIGARAPAAPGAAPAAPSGAVPHLTGPGIPRGVRNNNPGNIKDSSWTRSMPGYVGADPDGFARFDNPESGMKAMDALLTAYGRRGIKTIGEVINRWAPPTDNNPVESYARHVANGGDPNAPIDLANPETRRGIALRMAQFENGMVPPGGAPGAPGSVAGMSAEQTEALKRRLKAMFNAGGKGREAAWALLMKLTGPKDPIKVNEGDVVIDPDTYRELYRAPGKPQSVREGGALVQDGRVVYQAPGRGNRVEDDVAARRRIAEQLGQQNDPQMKIWVLTGKHPGEDRVSPTALKAIMEAEDENTNLTSTVDNLRRAQDLNKQTFTGYGANALRSIGTGLPEAMVPGGFRQVAKATEEWQKLMEPEALQTMARTLKGATTDFELRTFIRQLADPATTPETRGKIIERMIKLAEKNIAVNNARMDQLRGGTYTKPGGGQSSTQNSAVNEDMIRRAGENPEAVREEARRAIQAGAPKGPVLERLKRLKISTDGL